VAIIQRVELYFDDIFRKKSSNIFKEYAKSLISKIVRGNALVIGNLMHTGQHSLFHLNKEIEYKQYINEVYNAVNDISKQIKEKHNKRIRIIAFKDYFEDDIIHENDALTKKYRQRYKSARKKGKNITKKELSFNEVKENQDQLFKLYKNVSDNAGVNSFILPENHFTSLKEKMEDKFLYTNFKYRRAGNLLFRL